MSYTFSIIVAMSMSHDIGLLLINPYIGIVDCLKRSAPISTYSDEQTLDKYKNGTSSGEKC